MPPSKKAKIMTFKEELRNITTVNLMSNATSILEKILWIIIAFLGSFFIYEVFKTQLKNWNENPTLQTKTIRKLSEMPLPSMTFCHKGVQKYGVAEKLANMIDPEKEIPKEVLTIRNEFLKVQFQKIKSKLDGTDYCGWLFSLIGVEKGDHPILRKKSPDILQLMKDDCKVSKKLPLYRWVKLTIHILNLSSSRLKTKI